MSTPTDPLDKGSVPRQPGRKRVHCIRCGKHTKECGPLSTRFMCRKCGEGALMRAMREQYRHSGPYYDRWREAMIRLAQNL